MNLYVADASSTILTPINKMDSFPATYHINLDQLSLNCNYFKRTLAKNTHLLLMVKANAYGTGISGILKQIPTINPKYLGVAFTHEAISIRKLHPTIRLIVMNAGQDFLLCKKFDLEPSIYSIHQLHALIKSKIDLPIHIKIDSGMHRFGIPISKTDELIELLKTNPQLKVKSLFSHLAASSNADHHDFTLQQIKRFGSYCHKIELCLNKTLIKHILNSEGVLNFKEHQFDMVRIGIGAYGFPAKAIPSVRPISHIETTISQIKLVDKNQSIGYERNYTTTGTTKIGLIPVGYGDGFNRKLGHGKFKVKVGNVFVPTIGNINMDATIIDLTDISCNINDKVTIFTENYHIDRAASICDTTPYEILTNISERLPRVYY